ncbi:TolC family protein [Paludisphaera soli]|uniref:TolC family protein n=1 Tax=Paludisphaera soli TaxID=2712865 RepID=UPI0013EDF85A|nr:TolC family protein [Paludisphaera soli]
MRLRTSTLGPPTTLALALALAAPGAAAQGMPSISLPSEPRTSLPFGTQPDLLPGPPRAMGEVPAGDSPPSTLPGRVFGQPPRAMGESPEIPPVDSTSGPFAPGLDRAPSALPPRSSTGSPFSPPESLFPVPSGSPFYRLFPRLPGAAEGRSDELPPALPDAESRTPAAVLGAATGPPLGLGEVLRSVEGTHPLLLSTLQERGIAAGDLLSAQGAFDLNLNMDSRNYPLGYYNRGVHDVFFEQPTAWAGAKFFAGYRVAQGNFPTYYNYLNTRGGGAFVGGMELPLLKNREIDARRAKLYQAEIERRKAEPTVLKQRITLFKDASKSYWAWVAAGKTFALYGELVRVAELRNEGLENQARAGLVRTIDLADFRRILLSRQQQLIAAQRRAEQASIELSLYARDGYGMPRLPDAGRLPRTFPPTPAPDPDRLDRDLEVALRLRPEIYSLRLQARKAAVERRYAQNQLLPSMNLYVYTEQNFGPRAVDLLGDFRPFIMEASLLFDVPIQRRYAKGRVIAADSTIRQIDALARFAVDRVRADVQDATSALTTAYEQVVRYRENVELARRLEAAEAALVREGGSTVLFLNLREQAAADAEVLRVDAEAKYFAALAEYHAALGLDAVPADAPVPDESEAAPSRPGPSPAPGPGPGDPAPISSGG